VLQAKAFSTEFALAVAATAWPATPDVDETVGLLAARVTDWPLFLGIVRRHRIEGLAQRALRQGGVSVPTEVRETLRAMAARAALQAAAHTAWTLRLGRLFRDAGRSHLCSKG